MNLKAEEKTEYRSENDKDNKVASVYESLFY